MSLRVESADQPPLHRWDDDDITAERDVDEVFIGVSRALAGTNDYQIV